MEIRVEYSGRACILLALLFLTVPLHWIIAAVLAAVIHECCHLLAVAAVGGQVLKLRIGSGGAVMEASPLPPWKELVCILAGPMGSILLIAAAKVMPKVTICGLIQGIFNLLPLYPLDGGRAIDCIVRMCFSGETAEQFGRILQSVTVYLVLAAAVWCSAVWKLGFWPFFASLFLLSKVRSRKIPCKEKKVGVQYAYHI